MMSSIPLRRSSVFRVLFATYSWISGIAESAFNHSYSLLTPLIIPIDRPPPCISPVLTLPTPPRGVLLPSSPRATCCGHQKLRWANHSLPISATSEGRGGPEMGGEAELWALAGHCSTFSSRLYHSYTEGQVRSFVQLHRDDDDGDETPTWSPGSRSRSRASPGGNRLFAVVAWFPQT